jgi:hypothetical protein
LKSQPLYFSLDNGLIPRGISPEVSEEVGKRTNWCVKLCRLDIPSMGQKVMADFAVQ